MSVKAFPIRPSAGPQAGVSLRSFAPMLLLAVMWGLSIPVTKFGLLTAPPLTLTALRFAVAVPLLFLFTLGKPALPWRAVPRAAALGVLGIGVGQVAQTLGVQGTAASVGTIVSATIPVFVVIFAALRLKQPVTGRQRLGLAAAFAGIALVAFGHGQNGDPLMQSSVSGAAWLLLSAVAVAFYYVWSVELTRDFGTAAVAAWSTLFGFVALLPWAVREAVQTSFHITGQALGSAAYLGVVVTTAGLFLWLHILRTVPTPVAASVQYLQPVVGIVAAAVLFGDTLGLLFGAGVVLILGGLTLAAATRREPEEAVPHE